MYSLKNFDKLCTRTGFLDFLSHEIHLLALLSLLIRPNDRFPKPFHTLHLEISQRPFQYQKPFREEHRRIGRYKEYPSLPPGEFACARISGGTSIFPDCSYESALVRCGLPTLLSRRDEACRRFISNIKESGFLSHLLPQPTNVAHGYGLRSGFPRSEFRLVRTDRLSNFVTHSYNRI